MSDLLVVSSSPHIRSEASVNRIMLDVIIALIPACIVSVYLFGAGALQTLVLGIGAAVITEWALQKLMKKPVTVDDLSAAVTGLLLALCIPPTVPWWIPIVGSFIAIAIAKFPFGGLGYNIFNPAHIGRAFLLASWPVIMTTWKWPIREFPGVANLDAVTSATPLAMMKLSETATPYINLFLGNIAGSAGETSAAALLLGAVYLLYRRVISWQIPAAYLTTVIIGAIAFRQDPIFHLLAGGLILGAFFMATDYTTSPVTPRGQLIFGFGCGLLTILIRLYGGYPEGVCYSILIMNAITPLIDRYTQPRIYGEVKARA